MFRCSKRSCSTARICLQPAPAKLPSSGLRQRSATPSIKRPVCASVPCQWCPTVYQMKPDVVHILVRAASRLISTPALLCLLSTVAAQTVSSNWAETDVVYIIRIAYANARFTSGMPGWKTDRGRIYIKYGPPDEIESYPAASYQRPLEQGGGTTSMYPFEQWRYRYLKDIGTDVVFEFVDRTNTGEYRLIIDPTDKEAL